MKFGLSTLRRLGAVLLCGVALAACSPKKEEAAAPAVKTDFTIGWTIYAGWIDGIASPSPTFATGIDTNYGGSWHRITSPVLPNRFVAGLTVDPANPAHVYAVYNGYSRRWIPGGGEGVVFESTSGGRTWRNISGNLPDAPGDALAIVGGNLVLGTDVGVFLATTSAPTMWRRAPGLPNSSANSVRPVPGAQAVVIGTHGRGTWRIDF